MYKKQNCRFCSFYFLLVFLAGEEERKPETEQETEAKADAELGQEDKRPCLCCSEEADKDGKTAATCSCRRESSTSSEDSVLSSSKVGRIFSAVLYHVIPR